MYVAGLQLNLPLLCRLITVAVDSLDALMEQKDLSDSDSDEEQVNNNNNNVHNNVHDNAHNAHNTAADAADGDQQERSASYVSGGEKKVKGGGAQKKNADTKKEDAIITALPTLGDSARLLGIIVFEVLKFPPYYLVQVRPGLMMAIIFFNMSHVEAYKLCLYLLFILVLDAKVGAVQLESSLAHSLKAPGSNP
jgi:hypothetical protein